MHILHRKVLPDFAEHEGERERKKLERLAPHLEAALSRKSVLAPLSDDEIPEVVALGRQVAQQQADTGDALAGAEDASVPVPREDPGRR